MALRYCAYSLAAMEPKKRLSVIFSFDSKKWEIQERLIQELDGQK